MQRRQAKASEHHVRAGDATRQMAALFPDAAIGHEKIAMLNKSIAGRKGY
jgi:hypothetical protein